MAATIMLTFALGVFVSFTPDEWKEYFNELIKED